MITLFIAAAAALSLPQTAPAAPAAPVARAPLQVQLPELAGAQADPTCGGRPALAQQASCVVAVQSTMQGLADQYDAVFQGQGWLAADGRENLTVYVRRREGGGCDAFQQLAFADPTRAPAPDASGYFAFAAIPMDVCAATAPAAR